jgi:hypothetical protein
VTNLFATTRDYNLLFYLTSDFQLLTSDSCGGQFDVEAAEKIRLLVRRLLDGPHHKPLTMDED